MKIFARNGFQLADELIIIKEIYKTIFKENFRLVYFKTIITYVQKSQWFLLNCLGKADINTQVICMISALKVR